MLTYEHIAPEDIASSHATKPSTAQQDAIVTFLSQQLEQYGDPPAHIRACLTYALSNEAGKGGHVFLARAEAASTDASGVDDGIANESIVGAVILNRTGMHGYIPENILVYIATHRDYRGQGIGSQLLERVIRQVPGDIALHVDQDNPAIGLYQKLGFAIKYYEMRLLREPS